MKEDKSFLVPGCYQTDKRTKKSYLLVFALSCPRNASFLLKGAWNFLAQSLAY